MTPKQKAEEIADKYYFSDIFENITYEQAKDCAIICVDEITKYSKDKVYWQLVKEEIEKL